MAVSFDVPSSPARSVITIENFYGVDFTNNAAAVDISKSPNAVNMIRDVPGKVRKSMGYHRVFEDGSGRQINGHFWLIGSTDYELLHIGTNMYSVGLDADGNYEILSTVYSSMADTFSRAWQFGNKLYVSDGSGFYVYDGSTFKDVSTDAKIPTVTIAKAPSGGGTSYEPVNLLTTGFTELFLSDGTSTAYQLSFTGLDSTKPPTVQQLNSSGEWVTKTLGTDYTVNYTTGTINFVGGAPPVSPITGEDNIKITAYRTDNNYAQRIKRCTIGTQFNANGGVSRLFLSGNPDFINYDWFSEIDDPSYFPDINYCTVGSSESAIVGYCMINGTLCTFKDENEPSQTVVIRQSTTVNDVATFQVVNSLQGEPAIASRAFGYLENEPLFLTRLGIYAITSADVTGEKFGQCRSFYLNGKLLEESDLENAYAFNFKEMYFLVVNEQAYILDGLQALPPANSMPYSTRQYAAFYRTNFPVRVAWTREGELYFGTKDGKIQQFYSDADSPGSYNDDGEAIEAKWETPDIDGALFYKNKTFRYLAVRLKAAIRTSLKIYVMRRGLWDFLKEDHATANYLSFMNVIFSRFAFNSNATNKIIATKTRIKKVDKVRFRFVNDTVNEPFGLDSIACEYVQNGNYK